MFNIGFTEMIIIGIIVLLVIGPDKMPEFFRTATKWIVKMRRSVNDAKSTIQEEFSKVAGEEAEELKKLGQGMNLRRRVTLDSLEKYMEEGAGILEKGFQKKNDPKQVSPDVIDADNQQTDNTEALTDQDNTKDAADIVAEAFEKQTATRKQRSTNQRSAKQPSEKQQSEKPAPKHEADTLNEEDIPT